MRAGAPPRGEDDIGDAGIVDRQNLPRLVEDGAAAGAARQIEVVLNDISIEHAVAFALKWGTHGADSAVLECRDGIEVIEIPSLQFAGKPQRRYP